jgi:pimeloyl-ACP methyl ester carboxylesterase
VADRTREARKTALRHGDVVMEYRREGAGQSILFLHNGGTSSAIWRNQIAALPDRFDVTAVDLPGFGASPKPPRALTLDDYAEIVAALVDDQELAPAVIVGNCMGSNIAYKVASARPETAAGIVLVNPLTERTFDAGRIGILHTMQSWAPFPTRAIRGLARRLVPSKLAAREALRFELGPRGMSLGLHHDPELVACNCRSDQLPALVDILDDMESYGSLDRVAGELDAIPVCTVLGTRNRVLSPKAMRVLSARLRPEQSFELEGCGHLAMLEDPEKVTEIIAEFASAHSTLARGK